MNIKDAEFWLRSRYAQPGGQLLDLDAANAVKRAIMELTELRAALVWGDGVNRDLLAALGYALDWVDAVPAETPLPAMPGFDRDWVDEVIGTAQGEMK